MKNRRKLSIKKIGVWAKYTRRYNIVFLCTIKNDVGREFRCAGEVSKSNGR